MAAAPHISEQHAPAVELTGARPLGVYMMDLLPTVPYYTGALCAALNRERDVHLNIGSIRYHLDVDCFDRERLSLDRRLLDVATRLRSLPRALRRTCKFFEYLLNLVTLLSRFVISRPDILHVQFLPLLKFGVPVELWFLRFARAMGIKIVYTVHNVLPQDSGDRHRTVFRRIYQLSDRLICHDNSARLRLQHEFDIDPRRISVIPHGPLLKNRYAVSSGDARLRLGFDPTETLVLWQGIVRPYKGVSFLLDAWKVLTSKGISAARLAIVGDGDDSLLRELREKVAALSVQSSVRLDFRFVPVTDLQDYYAAADIIVYPYREITTSGALMTGLGHGKAIVATRQPAFSHVLEDNGNALMVDYGDIEGLAERLRRLIGDPALRSRLGNEARKIDAMGPQWPDLAAQTIACYRAVLTESRS